MTKTINPIANAQLEWTSNEIPACSFITMDIVWNPTVAWSTREILQFTDNRNFKKDVAVILKSIDKTLSTRAAVKRSSTMSKIHASDHRVITKKLALKSPSPRSKQLQLQLQQQQLLQQQRTRLSTLAVVNSANVNKKDTSMRAQGIGRKKVLGTHNQSNGMSAVCDGGQSTLPMNEKENMKPEDSSPPNMSAMLDALNFATPSTKNKFDATSNVDYLASLPTPNHEKNQSLFGSALNSQSIPSTHVYRNLNETETLMSTPFKINDQTTILSCYQTPMERTEVDNSRYFDDPNDRNLFAMQKTPAFTNGSSAVQLKEVHTVPAAISGRKLNLDVPNAFDARENELSFGINRTQTLSSPVGVPKLSIIEEEQSKIEMSETYTTQNEHHLTYNILETLPSSAAVQPKQATVQTTPENLVRDVQLISTPLSKKYMSMKELTDNNSNLSLEQKILKMNQGSMPNLHKLDKVKSIENNRYFYQSIEKDLPETSMVPPSMEHGDGGYDDMENFGDTSVCSVQSTVSTQSVAFNEHEIQAQSSRLNLNEIGRSQKTTQTITTTSTTTTTSKTTRTKTTTRQMQNLCFTIDKPTASSSTKPSSTMDLMTPITSNTKYLSASSPAVNKSTFEKPKFSQSIRDISSSAKSRPSVISFAASGRFTPSSLKKRGRDDTLDSSKKSLNKLSPPKRACLEPESPKSRGQAFRTKTWGGVMPKKFRIPSIPPQRLQLKRPEEERVILYDPELHMRSKCQCYPPQAFVFVFLNPIFNVSIQFKSEKPKQKCQFDNDKHHT